MHTFSLFIFCCWFSFFCRTFAVWKRSKMAEKKKCRDDKSRHCFVTMNCVCIHHTVDSIAEITGSSAMYCEVSSWSRDSQLVAVRLGWIHCCSALEECIFVSSVHVKQSRLFFSSIRCIAFSTCLCLSQSTMVGGCQPFLHTQLFSLVE